MRRQSRPAKKREGGRSEQDTHRCLRLGIVLHGGTDDPACVCYNRLVLRLEQLEQGVPELQNRHVVGVVDHLDELGLAPCSFHTGASSAYHLEVIERLYPFVYAVGCVQRDRHLLLHDQTVALAEDVIQHLARQVRSLLAGGSSVGGSKSLV